MNADKQPIFRKESLERLSTPEQLDQLMKVVSPRSWLSLTALGLLVLVALAWSIFGRLPVTVAGQAVLIQLRQVRSIQSPVTGQLLDLKMQVGDPVQKGDLLATIDQPDLRKQLQTQQAKLAELEGQNLSASQLQTQRSSLDLESIQQQRAGLQQRLRDVQALLPALQTLTPQLKEQELAALDKQQLNLQQRIADAQKLDSTLKSRFDDRQKLFSERGAISQDSVLEAEQTYLNNLRSISELQSQLGQLEVRRVEAQRTFVESRNRLLELTSQITTLNGQLQELQVKEKNLQQQNLEARTNRSNPIEDLKRSISVLDLQIKQNSEIHSEFAGQILEVTATVGQVISPTMRLATIAANDPTSKMVGLAFFPVKDGKKIRPDLIMQITPDTVKRERFGGILASVKTVDPFPSTRQSIATLIGNEQVAEMMTQTPQIVVLTELQPDPSAFSGYRWSSSKGPQLKITPGTTATARVTVEEQAPITLIFPFLRSLTGLY